MAIALLGALTGCGDGSATGPSPPESTVIATPVGFELEEVVITGAGAQAQEVAVWVADSAAERRRGLMGVTDLGEAAGMLFVFETPGLPRFFMWRTPMPLDIAFFASDGAFVDSASMEPCLHPPADACPGYVPAEPSLLALELPSGGLAELDLAPGASLARR